MQGSTPALHKHTWRYYWLFSLFGIPVSSYFTVRSLKVKREQDHGIQIELSHKVNSAQIDLLDVSVTLICCD